MIKPKWLCAERLKRTLGPAGQQAITLTYIACWGWRWPGQNRLTDAIGYLEKAVEINPANTWAHIHYGKALYFCSPDRIDLTVAQFDQALQLEPEVDIWQNLIQFWKSVGNQEEVTFPSGAGDLFISTTDVSLRST